jgi:cytoskeleton protein RodZ
MIESIGQQLRQAREARELSLEQVNQATHIRLHYLQALEAGDFASIPSEVQARGFIRSYASFLGLDAQPLLAGLQPNAPSVEPPLEKPQPASPGTENRPTGEPADAIFAEIGSKLKDRRELLGFSLEDVERHTHIRIHYLVALESGSLAQLPSPVQGRGMLSNYASFLGLDPEPLLLRFAEGLQARLASKQSARPTSQPGPARRRIHLPAAMRRIFSSELLIGAVLVLFLAAVVIWGATRILTLRTSRGSAPTAPSIAEALLATATITLTPTPPTLTPTAPPFQGSELLPTATPNPQGSPFPTLSGGVQVYVTARHRAFMRVLVDGKIEFDGRVLPGSAYSFAGKERVEILTGDGDALQVFYNQQDLGAIGLLSQVVDVVFTTEGIQTPTATITPSATASPRVTRTPAGTPQPSLTP